MGWVDDLVALIKKHPGISPIQKLVLIARVEKPPDKEELKEAHQELYGAEYG